jgi:hypothetical protein
MAGGRFRDWNLLNSDHAENHRKHWFFDLDSDKPWAYDQHPYFTTNLNGRSPERLNMIRWIDLFNSSRSGVAIIEVCFMADPEAGTAPWAGDKHTQQTQVVDVKRINCCRRTLVIKRYSLRSVLALAAWYWKARARNCLSRQMKRKTRVLT